MNEKPPTSLNTGDVKNLQYLEALNQAFLRVYSAGAFWWDDFFGSFITVPGKNTYPLTPVSTNYYPNARNLALATRANCSALPKHTPSFDDTYTMTRFAATSATASFERTVPHISDGTRVTFSLWLMADSAASPTSVTLSLIQSGNVAASKTVAVQTTPNRYSISAYLLPSTAQTRCRVTFTGAGSVLFADAAQYELTDYATEFIDNPTTAPVERVLYTSPERIRALTPYTYNKQLTFKDTVWRNTGLQPYEHRKVNSVFVEASVIAGSVVLQNAAPDTHYVYWGKRVPPSLKADTDTVTMPPDALSVVLAGARAYIIRADYDIGSNTQVAKDEGYFEGRIQDLLDTYSPLPGTASVALSRVVWG